MAGRKLNAKRRVEHLAEVASLYLCGMRQWQIAEKLEVSPQTITYDLKILQKQWRASTMADLSAAKGKELAKLDELEREYWAAWERSKAPRERTRTGRTTGEKLIESALMEREQRDGNPVFLDGVLKCITKRCQILGLDAPQEIMVEDKAEWLAQKYGLQKEDLLATANTIAEQRWRETNRQ